MKTLEFFIASMFLIVLVASGSIPEPYYQPASNGTHTLMDLMYALAWAMPDKPYENRVWDCSNMASYLQWKLANQGFDARICTSGKFEGFAGRREQAHAWVSVVLGGQSKRTYVEATAQNLADMVIRSKDKNYKYYDVVQNNESLELENIYEIQEHMNLTEFDWWTPLKDSLPGGFDGT